MGRRQNTNLNDSTTNKLNPLLGLFNKGVYTNKDLMVLLDCSEKTLRGYRTNGYLGFTQLGDKIYYTSIDIVNFLTSNHHKPYRLEVVS